MNKISSLALFVAIATVTFLAGFWVLVLPQLDQLGDLHARQEVLRDEPIITALSIKRSIQTNNLEQTKQLAEILLPEQDNQYDLSVQIEGLATQLGLPLTSLTMTPNTGGVVPKTSKEVQKAIPSIPAQKITVQVGVNGEYGRVQQFVNSLPTLNRFIQITEVNLTSGSGDSSPVSGNSVNASIIAAVYYLPKK